jgi:phospholipid-binding lipoprotein MlaA
VSFRFLLTALCVAVFAAGAQAAVPAELAQRIAAAAQEGRANIQRETERASRTGDAAITQMMTTRARAQAGDTLCAVVIGGIAENPTLLNEIVASAQSAAPELAGEVQRRVSEAYPYLAGQVAQVRMPPPSSRSVAPAPSARPIVEDEPSGPPPATNSLPEVIYDPFEGMNRGIFEFNDVFDRFLLRPIAWAYGKVMPDVAKTSVRNFFRNLGSPARFANDAMQGTVDDAGNTLMRFLINTTIGVGGLFEVAEDWGFPYKPSDFGITMHTYGVNGGPYLMLPLLGPTTFRDGTGLIVDMALDPFSWLADTAVNGGLLGGRVVTTRERLIEPLDDLRKGSLDYYAALRSAYYQDRATELRKGVPRLTYDSLDKEFDEAQ